MKLMSCCRACKSGKIYMVLPLGSHPPANAFLSKEQLNEPEPSWSLDTQVCLDCGLIQVPQQIPADFFRHYLYVPSASATLHRHFAGLAETLTEKFLTSPGALVIDIGSNDGLLLNVFKNLGAKTLGIEPATNLTQLARQKGLEIVNEYFSPELAKALRQKYGPAAVVVTTNTFNHIDDLHSFVEGVSMVLGDDGVFVIEVPQALDFIQKNEFDTVYHEHLSTFSVKSLVDLFRFFDMEVFDLERLEIHGGSMRVYGQKKRAGRSPRPIVAEWLAREERGGLFLAATYDTFRQSVLRIKEQLLTLLRQLKQDGKRIVGYGAPAKGSTLLNYYRIGTDLLDYLVDKNELKQGLYSPGMHIPIFPAEKLLKHKPDYVLILAWNFADEIMSQQEEYRRQGGKFILPIPEVRVVS